MNFSTSHIDIVIVADAADALSLSTVDYFEGVYANGSHIPVVVGFVVAVMVAVCGADVCTAAKWPAAVETKAKGSHTTTHRMQI